MKKTSRVEIKVILNGVLLDDSTKYVDIESIKALVNNFPQRVHRSGKVLEYKKSSLFHAVQDLPQNINSADFINMIGQGYKLKTIESNYNSLLSALPDLNYVIDNSQQFTRQSFNLAKALYSQNYQAMRIYEHNWKICATSPELCDKCLIFTYKPTPFVPEPSDVPTPPITKEFPLLISPAYTSLIVVKANTIANVLIEGKVQYNHIGPLDCRVPSRTSLDFNIGLGEFPGGGGVVPRIKIMPWLEFQYFEIVDGREIEYGGSFPYRGAQIDVPANPRDLTLKYRMNLEWVYFDRNMEVLTYTPRPVDQKDLHISQHIHSCGSTPLKAIVVQ